MTRLMTGDKLISWKRANPRTPRNIRDLSTPEMYRSGMGTREIGEQFGVSSTQIRSDLKRLGVVDGEERRGRPRSKTRVETEEISRTGGPKKFRNYTCIVEIDKNGHETVICSVHLESEEILRLDDSDFEQEIIIPVRCVPKLIQVLRKTLTRVGSKDEEK